MTENPADSLPVLLLRSPAEELSLDPTLAGHAEELLARAKNATPNQLHLRRQRPIEHLARRGGGFERFNDARIKFEHTLQASEKFEMGIGCLWCGFDISKFDAQGESSVNAAVVVRGMLGRVVTLGYPFVDGVHPCRQLGAPPLQCREVRQWARRADWGGFTFDVARPASHQDQHQQPDSSRSRQAHDTNDASIS